MQAMILTAPKRLPVYRALNDGMIEDEILTVVCPRFLWFFAF